MRAPAILLAIPLTIGCALGLLICTSSGGAAHVGDQPADVFAACAAAAALLALIGCIGALAADPEGALESTVCARSGASSSACRRASMRLSVPIGRRSTSGSLPAIP